MLGWRHKASPSSRCELCYRSLLMTNVKSLKEATFGSEWKQVEAAVGVRDQVTRERRS